MIDDLAQDLSNAGLGTIGQNIFKSYLPDADNEAIAILDTGGPKPDANISSMKNPMFQIIIRANTYAAGKSTVDAIRSRLHGVQNRTIGSTYFYFIHAQSEGGHIGRNERGQDEFSMNFICKMR